ncbi:MAG: hypothetical protein JEY97_09145 [Bacteroidales bacterium]|nr:hypothetical protein [Bacteroidales bacterium]
MTNSKILLYQTENGQIKIDARLKEETDWLSLSQMSELFQVEGSMLPRKDKKYLHTGANSDVDCTF